MSDNISEIVQGRDIVTVED